MRVCQLFGECIYWKMTKLFFNVKLTTINVCAQILKDCALPVCTRL